MKKFLIKLFIFFSPIIIILYGSDVFISKNLIKSNSGENSDWRDIFNGTVNADIVIYGASRAWQHIDSKIVADSLERNTYNLGIHAYNFEMQYLRHRLLLKYNRKPKLIIHSLDFLTFAKRSDLFDPGQFLPYMLFDTLIKKYTIDYTGYTWYDYEIPLIRYYGQVSYIHRAVSLFTHQIQNIPDRIKGYNSYDAQFTNVFADGKTSLKSYEIKFDPATIELFDRYLYQCKKDKIKVIFVYTPEYIVGQRFVGNRKQLFELIYHFTEKYRIPLYDYSKDPMCDNAAYFYNCEHLNKKGAQLFTKKFAGDLRRDKKDILKLF